MARPLQKTYSKTHPYVVERHDQEDGAIHYEIWDHRPDSYHRLCTVKEDYCDDNDDGDSDRGQSCRVYERLAEGGFVKEVPDSNPFFRRFEITDIGRKKASFPSDEK